MVLKCNQDYHTTYECTFDPLSSFQYVLRYNFRNVFLIKMNTFSVHYHGLIIRICIIYNYITITIYYYILCTKLLCDGFGYIVGKHFFYNNFGVVKCSNSISTNLIIIIICSYTALQRNTNIIIGKGLFDFNIINYHSIYRSCAKLHKSFTFDLMLHYWTSTHTTK